MEMTNGIILCFLPNYNRVLCKDIYSLPYIKRFKFSYFAIMYTQGKLQR